MIASLNQRGLLSMSAAALLLLVGATVFVVGLRTRRAGLDRVLRIGER